jgi:hypothetical protein
MLSSIFFIVLKCPDVYTTLPPNTPAPVMTDFVFEMLSKCFQPFLGNKQINPCGFSKHIMKKVLGESEVEAVLGRSVYLTQDEAQMTP